MTRALAFLAALSLAGPAAAATYSAKPATPIAAKRIIGANIVWNCGPDACQGSTEESRPARLCQSLAKRTGRLSSFIVDGRAFGPVELDLCNASAPGGPAPALARVQ